MEKKRILIFAMVVIMILIIIAIAYILYTGIQDAKNSIDRPIRGQLINGTSRLNIQRNQTANQTGSVGTRAINTVSSSSNSNVNPVVNCSDSDWLYSLFPAECPSNKNQTRTWSKIGQCAGGINHNSSEIISCVQNIPCTNISYGGWNNCTQSGTQSRQIVNSFPTECTPRNPVLSQQCIYIPPCTENDFTSSLSPADCPSSGNQTKVWSKAGNCSQGVNHDTNQIISCNFTVPTCTYFTYTDWNSCSQSGTQSRQILTSSPGDCYGGNPIIVQQCVYIPPCTENDFTFSLNPETCPSSRQQTKNWVKIGNCLGGVNHDAAETVSCNYQAPLCTGFTYSPWSDCMSSGIQSRQVITSSPKDCEGGNPVLSQQCNYVPPCNPICSGKQCGGDNCGGSCGTCPSNEYSCSNGICIVSLNSKNIVALNRFANVDIYNEHFYTTDQNEKNSVIKNTNFVYEGIIGYVFNIQISGSVPLYRFYSSSTGDHFYTMDENEKNGLMPNNNYRYEGIAGYVLNSQLPNTIPFYRLYDKSKYHFYTVDENEKNVLVKSTKWSYEGVMGYVIKNTNSTKIYAGVYSHKLDSERSNELSSYLDKFSSNIDGLESTQFEGLSASVVNKAHSKGMIVMSHSGAGVQEALGLARLGVDIIELDEYNGRGASLGTTFNDLKRQIKAINPNCQVGIVEAGPKWYQPWINEGADPDVIGLEQYLNSNLVFDADYTPTYYDFIKQVALKFPNAKIHVWINSPGQIQTYFGRSDAIILFDVDRKLGIQNWPPLSLNDIENNLKGIKSY